MTIDAAGARKPNVPAYVREWVDKVVVAPTSTVPRKGVVTSVRKQRIKSDYAIIAHVAIYDGPLVICNVRELHVLVGEYSAQQEKQQSVASVE